MKYLLILLLTLLISGCETTKNSYSKINEMPYVKECFQKAKKIKYKHEEGDYWQLPAETEKLKTGDCEDSAFYLQYLLIKKSVNSKIVIGYTMSSNPLKELEEKSSLHAWNEVEINGEMYVADATSGYFEKKTKHKGMHEWNITHNKSTLSQYEGMIKYYVHRAKVYEMDKFASSISRSFFEIK